MYKKHSLKHVLNRSVLNMFKIFCFKLANPKVGTYISKQLTLFLTSY